MANKVYLKRVPEYNYCEGCYLNEEGCRCATNAKILQDEYRRNLLCADDKFIYTKVTKDEYIYGPKTDFIIL